MDTPAPVVILPACSHVGFWVTIIVLVFLLGSFAVANAATMRELQRLRRKERKENPVPGIVPGRVGNCSED